MYYSYVEIEYVATSFSPARTDLALKLLKENSYMSDIILHRSLILELKFYKSYVLICIMFSSLVKRAFTYKLFYELILF
jgi:hypothetical protein